MTRIIEIFDDNKESIEISSDDLPLEVYLQKEKKNKLIITSLNKEDNDVQGKGEDKNICGYIAQDDDHLFFQPDKGKTENIIFHNDEIIKKSVWLKSGDTIEITQKIISYSVSGDRVQVIVSNKPETTIITPPSNNQILIDNHQQTDLAIQQSKNKNTYIKPADNKEKKIKSRLIVFLLFILSLLAVFLLIAETAIINIKPQADNISLTGIFPAIKFNERYILIGGKYTLDARKQGYRPLNKVLDINSENKEFIFTMKENPGIIQFDINPASNNKIYIDELLLGDSIDIDNKEYLHEYEIDKGEHTLSVINPRYKKYEQKIKVEGKNIQQKYTVDLQPDWGVIKAESSQEDTKIIIYAKNNKEATVYNEIINSLTEIELLSGEYTIYISKEKFKDITENLTIKAGDNISLRPFKLEPEDGILHLSSIPSESIIRIDGQYSGKTPQTLKLSPFEEHLIELSLTGYTSTKKSIKLEPEVILEKEIKLAANSGLVFVSVSPKHADLYIDGIKQKENSGKFKLSGNKHQLSVKAKGYQTQTKKIIISTYSKNISFILKKNSVNKTHSTKKVSNKSGLSKQAIKNKNYKNSINQKMILVKPALFMMGSKKSEAGRSSNEREKKIQINYVYFLSEKEISNKQYRQFKQSHNSGTSAGKSLNLDNQPVVNISWQDAARFANWLSKKESLQAYYKEINGKLLPNNIDGTINGYRLPFEAEWALAARGKYQKKYSWGETYPPITSSGNFADDTASTHISNTIAGYNDKQSVSAPIGSYKKNKTGFYDMGGNVSEWCQDYYSPSSKISANKININPKGPEKGTHKVVKDASWRDGSIKELRLSYRSYSKKKSNDIGFRLARYAQ